MSSLLSFLLRSGSRILGEGAEIFLTRALVRVATQRLRNFIVFHAAVAILAIAALGFFYVLVDRWLALWLDERSAAAILCGGNVLLIAVLLAGRALIRPKAAPVPASPIVELLRSQARQLSQAGSLGAKDPNFDAGIAIGNQLARHVRKATPQIALAAALIGLVIGVRPQILDLFRRRARPEDQPRR